MDSRGRRSLRLKGHDYTAAGGYFITAVKLWRECLFGEVVEGKMQLSTLGEIVKEEWFKTTALRPYVDLQMDEFVVMPNHIHGIIWIVNDFVGTRRRRVPTCEIFSKPVPGSIPTIVRAFKSAVTYRANRELNAANIWQRNYYEHIIRNQQDHERITAYIAVNPANWPEDKDNPRNAISKVQEVNFSSNCR